MAKIIRHENNGKCARCALLFDRYPGFHLGLKAWFEALQAKHTDAHISCAGRGRREQTDAFIRGASNARFGQSAHNYNAAIDVFELRGVVAKWDSEWFRKTVKPAITAELNWYGSPGSPFPEMAHVEWRSWRKLKEDGALRRVE